MSSLFGLNKPNTNLRKNVFDLSQKVLFSQSAGLLVPCLTRELNPGEKVEINLSALTRTAPLNTAAYVRLRQYFHFFFVPYKQLWSGWDNFINGVDYKTSSLQKNKKYSMIPGIDLLSCIKDLVKSGKLLPGIGGSPRNQGEFRPIIHPDTHVDLHKLYDEQGYALYKGMSRLFDMLGYGISFRTSTSDKKVFRSLDELVEGLDLNSPNVSNKFDTYFTNTQKVNPFRLLAYQKIYSDFYKRDDYEVTDPSCFNIDDFDGTEALTMTSLGAERLINMFRLRYRWQPKDYFTGVVPSELFGLNGVNFSTSSYDPSPLLSYVDADGNDVNMHNAGSVLSVRTIRSAFALEKLLRLTRRAGGHDYISQTMAHYGFEPPKGRGDKVEFIGGFSNPINISEVVTTANGSVDGNVSIVGQISGKGLGASTENKEFDFTAKEHGILMCISSVVPDTDYSAEGLNIFNTKLQRGDYFHPEFQDLGLQPIFNYELSNSFGSSQSINDRVCVLGYAPRYAEYKTAYDTLHGEFRNGRSLSAWSASTLLSSGRNGVNRSTLKINPKVLDRIMVSNFDGSEESDQFMVNAQFIIKAIRPMSITGQNL